MLADSSRHLFTHLVIRFYFCTQLLFFFFFFLPVCGFLLTGILRIALHILMAALRLLFPGTARWVALGKLLAGLEVLNDVLLVPWLIAWPDINRRGSRVRCQNAVRGAVVLTESSSVPGVTLQPDRCSPMVQTFLLDVAPIPSWGLSAVAEPAPAEPEDLLHVELLFSRHRHPIHPRCDASGTWNPRNNEAESWLQRLHLFCLCCRFWPIKGRCLQLLPCVLFPLFSNSVCSLSLVIAHTWYPLPVPPSSLPFVVLCLSALGMLTATCSDSSHK